jgi:hypothetical protein
MLKIAREIALIVAALVAFGVATHEFTPEYVTFLGLFAMARAIFLLWERPERKRRKQA